MSCGEAVMRVGFAALACNPWRTWPFFACVLLSASPSLASSMRCDEFANQDFMSLPDAPTQLMSSVRREQEEGTPAHCQVRGYVAPNIGFQILLPVHWNGKLIEVGCGGHCGSFEDFLLPMQCSDALTREYACAASDMGHRGYPSDALWGYQNLPAKIDWAFRASHVVAVAAKAVVERFYGAAPRRSYFLGCSTGGRQALQEAQRFPWDFDGIVAGAPPINLSVVYLNIAWSIRAARETDGEALLSKGALQLLSSAAVAKCDLDDGLKDGVISDPRHCSIEPSALTCRAGEAQGCLTPAQVQAVRKIYGGPTTSTGMRLSPGGPLPGSELGWARYLPLRGPLSGDERVAAGYEKLATDGFRFLLFLPEAGSSWTLRYLDFDRDYNRLSLMQALYDSSNPDLQTFKDAGGKLLIFQGLNDYAVLPRDTINYYDKVVRTMGGRSQTESFVRMFLLPGVGHCSGGGGADTVDYLSALDDWVEHGRAPDRLIAAKVKGSSPKAAHWLPAPHEQVEFTRPLYPYPLRARYRGSGDPNHAGNFESVE